MTNRETLVKMRTPVKCHKRVVAESANPARNRGKSKEKTFALCE
jgi:hypothetical protein